MRTGELLFGLAVSFGLAGQGWAADDLVARVGRVSATTGQVQYHSPAGGWSDALVNEPMAAGAGLRTAQNAEAEWRSPGARLALAPATEIRVLRLDGETLQIALANGRVGIHLDRTELVEIDLPQGGIWLTKAGDYDIAAGDERAAAAIRVFSGRAELGGGLDDRNFAAAERDSFGDWWQSRDDNAAAAEKLPSPDIADVTALAAAGRWEHDFKHGDVWYPSDIAVDWRPYSHGVWRFLPPWGWTWIDDEAWGFTPSHYGRWAQINGRWGWVPGDEAHAANYSPAVVGFLGTAGIGLSRPGDYGAPPAVAWFPLAPGETIGDADGAYHNRRFATAVPRAAFTTGQTVASTMIDDIPAQRFVDAPVILDTLGIAPGAAAPAKKPVAIAASAAAAPVAGTPPVAAEANRQPYIVALRDAPVRPLVHEIRRRLRVVVATAAKVRPLAGAVRSPHNRQHLAAARGGA